MIKKIKVIITASLGTYFEWMEYAFFGYMAIKIAHVFFPHTGHKLALLAIFSIFAVGFLMRPIGAAIYGYIGDRLGRKTALSNSLLVMGIATLTIGLLPGFNMIGITAPILLTICRMIQGLSIAGEFNGATIFLIEHAPIGHKHLHSSWTAVAATLGMLTGAISATIVNHQHLLTWAWRAPFLLGGLLCLLGIYLRKHLDETPEFLCWQKNLMLSTKPLRSTFCEHKLALFQALSIAAFISIYICVCNIYFVTFLIKFVGFTPYHATLISAFGQIVTVLFFPIMANIADLVGARTIMLIGLIGATITAPMLFLIALMHNFTLAAASQVLYAIFNAAVFAPLLKFISELFPINTRYSCYAIAWNVAGAVFGGTAPLIAQFSITKLHILEGPAIYVAFSAMLAFIVILYAQRHAYYRSQAVEVD